MEESDLEFVLDLVDRFPLREEFADNLEHPDPVLLRLLPRGRLALLARRIQMVNLVNREAPRWTKSLRGSALPHRTSCASRMNALDQSIRKFAEEPTKSVIKPELGISFDSLDDAYDFYSLYSWEVGFGIRYGQSRLNAERIKSMQEIVCGCSLSCGTTYYAWVSFLCSFGLKKRHHGVS
ncbi:hypothetical protein ACQJBY_024021 [Aegilops geniculata]